jgi:hypothetical protein
VISVITSLGDKVVCTVKRVVGIVRVLLVGGAGSALQGHHPP